MRFWLNSITTHPVGVYMVNRCWKRDEDRSFTLSCIFFPVWRMMLDLPICDNVPINVYSPWYHMWNVQSIPIDRGWRANGNICTHVCVTWSKRDRHSFFGRRKPTGLEERRDGSCPAYCFYLLVSGDDSARWCDNIGFSVPEDDRSFCC